MASRSHIIQIAGSQKTVATQVYAIVILPFASVSSQTCRRSLYLKSQRVVFHYDQRLMYWLKYACRNKNSRKPYAVCLETEQVFDLKRIQLVVKTLSVIDSVLYLGRIVIHIAVSRRGHDGIALYLFETALVIRLVNQHIAVQVLYRGLQHHQLGRIVKHRHIKIQAVDVRKFQREVFVREFAVFTAHLETSRHHIAVKLKTSVLLHSYFSVVRTYNDVVSVAQGKSLNSVHSQFHVKNVHFGIGFSLGC